MMKKQGRKPWGISINEKLLKFDEKIKKKTDHLCNVLQK